MLVAAAVVLAVPWPAEGTSSGPRREFVDSIIIHAIGGPSWEAGRLVFSGAPGDAQRWKEFFDRHPFLGIHYVVDRDGLALASTPEVRVANHALDNNATSIGIELVQATGSNPLREAADHRPDSAPQVDPFPRRGAHREHQGPQRGRRAHVLHPGANCP
jgi:N-acetylmuramoyl-L-alanine amidase